MKKQVFQCQSLYSNISCLLSIKGPRTLALISVDHHIHCHTKPQHVLQTLHLHCRPCGLRLRQPSASAWAQAWFPRRRCHCQPLHRYSSSDVQRCLRCPHCLLGLWNIRWLVWPHHLRLSCQTFEWMNPHSDNSVYRMKSNHLDYLWSGSVITTQNTNGNL